MKLVELELWNVRGLPHLLVKPNGRNFAVWGPNGSGKSAVVDALDFLLTGRISRLTGKGTAGISLTKHGPHIDRKPKDARVRAVVLLPGLKAPVEIRRCMATPHKLESDTSAQPQLQRIEALAQGGQHVLTRRDILKYVTAESSTRAQEIQDLLNISEIEDIRKSLVKVQNNLEKEHQGAKRGREQAIAAVNSTVGRQVFEESAVLKVVNDSRTLLEGKPISALRSTELQKGLSAPSVLPSDGRVNVALLEKDVENLLAVTSAENREQISKSDKELRQSIDKVRSNPKLLRELSRLQLTELGLTLIDETGKCPLCDKPWPPGKLRQHLEERLSTAKLAREQQQHISELSDAIVKPLNNASANLQKIRQAAKAVELKDDKRELDSWVDDLELLSETLSAPVQKYPHPHFTTDRVRRLLAPENVRDLLDRVHSAAKAKYPPATAQQTAWDTLTRLQENLSSVEIARDNLHSSELSYTRAAVLLHSFQVCRNKVLQRLYDNVRDRFVALYRQLHKVDEDSFSAKIQPEGAGLNFEVDFYGRGTHPPHALHSEGHQDSMGICLFLALAEHLTGDLIDLTILDDVVMSIDSDHRRQLCRVLATSFPGRQFLITTHDRTWASQLRSEGIVDSARSVGFSNWHIETGPQVCLETDMWKRIKEDLQRSDVPAAAARLRRGSEEYFRHVCDSLRAEVPLKLTEQWELGDLVPAAMKRYRELLGEAKRSANSWNSRDCLEMLKEVASTATAIFARTQAEQWAVNVNVHYNNWTDFSKNDFEPVVEAFQDLYRLFVCSQCGTMLRLSTEGTKAVAVRCNCGKVDWNLVEKTK